MYSIDDIKDLFLLEFYGRLTRDIELFLPLFPCSSSLLLTKGVSCLPNVNPLTYRYPFNYRFVDYNQQIDSFLNGFPKILSILHLGKGKISLCGVELMVNGKVGHKEKFNFYFDCCTVSEANELLIASINILGDGYYETRDDVLCFSCDNFIGTFHKNIYQNKGEILLSLPMIYRHGYNPAIGYFADLSGLVTLKIGACPVDINFMITNLRDLGFDVLLLGINRKFSYGDKLDTKNRHNDYNVTLRGEDSSLKSISFSELLSTTHMKVYNYIHKRTPKISNWIPDYCSTNIGIDDDRYVALSNIRTKFNIDNTIFRILCFYWLCAEVDIAKKRLLRYS